MKRILFALAVVALVLMAAFVPAASAQNSAEIGVYGDYFRLSKNEYQSGGTRRASRNKRLAAAILRSGNELRLRTGLHRGLYEHGHRHNHHPSFQRPAPLRLVRAEGREPRPVGISFRGSSVPQSPQEPPIRLPQKTTIMRWANFSCLQKLKEGWGHPPQPSVTKTDHCRSPSQTFQQSSSSSPAIASCSLLPLPCEMAT
jgi:hypothetical protein